jgi:hypothetical protein
VKIRIKTVCGLFLSGLLNRLLIFINSRLCDLLEHIEDPTYSQDQHKNEETELLLERRALQAFITVTSCIDLLIGCIGGTSTAKHAFIALRALGILPASIIYKIHIKPYLQASSDRQSYILIFLLSFFIFLHVPLLSTRSAPPGH